MYFRLIVIFTLATQLSMAQLSVRNNAYIFVNDQVVFVEDEINLAEAASTIYLRSEAQLVQGSGTETVSSAKNTGLGLLSVYQDGNVGAHEYNYWCSPIGSRTGSTVNNPFGITLLHDIDTTDPDRIAVLSTTYVHNSNYNGTSSPLNIEPYWIWKFIAQSNYADWVHVEDRTDINPGEGFTMKGTVGSGDNQNYDFRGKPNTGTIAVAVAAGQLSLVGNPYPSAMDAYAYIHDAENSLVIDGDLSFWEQDKSVNSHQINEYNGGYAKYTIDAALVETFTPATFSTYNLDGSIRGTGGTGTAVGPERYIPIGQGFMVEGIAGGVVKAKNAHRVYYKESGVESHFFKNSNTKAKNKAELKTTADGFYKVPNDYKRFRLNIDFNNTYTRQLLGNFHHKATLDFDYGMECTLNADDILSSDAFLGNTDRMYAAEALPFDASLKIPLTITLAQDMPVRIRIADIQNFDSSQPIYIHDKENDLYVNLKAQDFDMNLEAGDYSDRFEVTFSSKTLNISENSFNDFNIVQNNSISELKVVNPNTLDITSFNLFDISGKQVLKQDISEVKNSYTYSTKSLSDGVYIARIRLKNNLGFTKKVIISNKK